MVKKLFYLFWILISGVVLCAEDAILLPASFEASFTQTLTSDANKTIRYQGEVKYSTPDHFRWHYDTPTKKDVCSDARKIEIINHDLEQVSTYIVDKGLNLPVIVQNAKPYRKTVYIAKYKGVSYTIQVNNKGELSRIAYRDELDNNVLIILTQMKYSSQKIDDAKLQCSYPETYDMVGG